MIYHQLTIQVSDRIRNALIGRLMALGSLGVVEQDGSVIAYFPGTQPLQGITRELDIMQSLIDRSGDGPSFTVQHDILQDADWNESWKKAFNRQTEAATNQGEAIRRCSKNLGLFS